MFLFFFCQNLNLNWRWIFFLSPLTLKSHVLLIYLCVFPLTASAPLFVHEAWINTASVTISEDHADERSAWTQEKLDTKEPKGTLLFFQLFRSFCPGLSISPEAKEKKTKLNSLYHPEDHRRLFDSGAKGPWSPKERKNGLLEGAYTARISDYWSRGASGCQTFNLYSFVFP